MRLKASSASYAGTCKLPPAVSRCSRLGLMVLQPESLSEPAPNVLTSGSHLQVRDITDSSQIDGLHA